MKKNFTKIFMTVCFMFLMSTVSFSQFFTEDFDGALPADWITEQNDGSPVNVTSNWVHTTTGPAGGFPIDPIESTTAANGWMMFDSDLNCSGEQDVRLISPSIDCTNKALVFLQFQTYYQRFNDLIYVQISTNNMATWTDIDLFPDLNNNDFAGAVDGSENPLIVTQDITAIAAGMSDVRIAFRFLSDNSTIQAGNYTGCGYAWQIDDVSLTDEDPTPDFDMRANRNFFAIPPSILTPASQIDPAGIGFLCDIENIGLMDVNNVNLNISILDPNGAEVHTQDLAYGTIPAGVIDENRIFPLRYTPDPVLGVYNGTYSITMDETDEAPGNNDIEFQFGITDSTFAKEGGFGLFAGGPPAGSTTEWTLATSYYVPNGAGMECTSILFSIGNAAAVPGGTAIITLYKWEDINDNGLPTSDEKDGTLGGAIIGNTSYTIQGTETDITVPMVNFLNPGEPVLLEDNTHYIVAVATTAPGGATDYVTMVGAGPEILDYSAMEFLNDSLNTERYTSYWNITSADIFADYTGVAFAPRIRMHVNPFVPVATENQLAEENRVKVFPNPATDFINVDLDFVETFENINIKITDVKGSVVLQKDYENIDRTQLKLNVGDFAQGKYFLHLTTPSGERTKSFVIVK